MINIDCAQINQDKWSEPKYNEKDAKPHINKYNELLSNIEPLNKCGDIDKKNSISNKEELDSLGSISKPTKDFNEEEKITVDFFVKALFV